MERPNIYQFDQVFLFDSSHGYKSSVWSTIIENRRRMGGKLFFDRLLEMLNVKDRHLYPPRSLSELQKLHASIVASSGDDQHGHSTPVAEHHKLSLLYYILCDCSISTAGTPAQSFFPHDLSRRAGREASVSTVRTRASRSPSGPADPDYGELSTASAAAAGEHSPAERFASVAAIPVQYLIFMRGLRDLDRFHVVEAVDQLVHPAVDALFFDLILQFLIKYTIESVEPGKLASDQTRPIATLPLQFFSSSPRRPQSIEAITDYVRYVTIFIGADAAVSHISRFPADSKDESRALFELIIDTVLSHPSLMAVDQKSGPNKPTGQFTIRSVRSSELITAVLTADQEDWFEHFLLVGAGKALPNSRDTVLMRRLGRGRPMDDIVTVGPGEPSMSTVGPSWADCVRLADLPAGVAKTEAYLRAAAKLDLD